MLFRFFIFFLSLIFLGALEVSVFFEGLFFQVLFFLVFFSVLIIWPVTKRFRFLALPFFLSIGSLNLLFLIDNSIEKHIFAVISSIVYYFSILGVYRLKKYKCDQTAQGIVNFVTLASAFFWFVSNYGWYLNFEIGIWALVLTFVGSTFLINWSSLAICEESFTIITKSKGFHGDLIDGSQVVFFLNMILSIIMGQVIWGLSFWPFGYLTTGLVALIIYFLFWDIFRLFILKRLTKRLVLSDVFLTCFLISVLLFTARWNLVN